MIRIESIHRFAIRLVCAAGIVVIGLNEATAEQSATVVAEASTSAVQVAEPFSLELTVTAPAGSKVTFPSTGAQLGGFDVIDTQDIFDIPDATSADTRTWTRRMTLESIVTGEQSISPLEVQVSGHDGSHVIYSNPVTVQVLSVLEDRGDPTRFRDIQSVVDVAVPTSRSNTWVWSALGGGVGLALFAAAGLVVSRRRNWLTPKEWAIQELDDLEKSIDSQHVNSDAIALDLSRIVRDYLQLQFAIPKSGHTSQELVRLIDSNADVDEKAACQLRELFGLADQAKFAGFQLSQAGLKSAINDSRDLVQRIAGELEAKIQQTDATEDN